jgi:hypothetical protein
MWPLITVLHWQIGEATKNGQAIFLVIFTRLLFFWWGGSQVIERGNGYLLRFSSRRVSVVPIAPARPLISFNSMVADYFRYFSKIKKLLILNRLRATAVMRCCSPVHQIKATKYKGWHTATAAVMCL